MAATAALYLGSAAHQILNHKDSMHGKEAMVIDFPILHLDKEYNALYLDSVILCLREGRR